MPLKRSWYRNIMKGVLLFCTVLHTFWYSQDTWTVCLLIFKNKYYKGKWRVDSGLFIEHNGTMQFSWKRKKLLSDTDISIIESFERVSTHLFVIYILYRWNDRIREDKMAFSQVQDSDWITQKQTQTVIWTEKMKNNVCISVCMFMYIAKQNEDKWLDDDYIL